MIFALKNLKTVILTNPLGLLAVGLSAVAAAFVDFGGSMDMPIEKVEDFRKRLEGLNGAMKEFEIQNRIKALKEQKAQLQEQLDDFAELVGKDSDVYKEAFRRSGIGDINKELFQLQLLLGGARAETEKAAQAEKAAAQATLDHAAALELFNEEAQRYNDLHGMQMAELLDTTADKINTKMIPALENLGLEIEDSFVNDFRVMPWAEEAFNKMLKLREAAKAVRLEVQAIVQDATARVLEDLGSALGAALSSAQDGFNLMAATLRNLGSMLQEIGKLLIKTAVSFITFKKTLFTNPVAAAAAGIAFVAAGALLKAKADQFEAPALAQGGLAYGPTMALVGDNRSASIDPEVIAPLSKLRDMMGGNTVEVVGRISGNDIFLSNARATTSRNRYA
jgi:hypothetical protein